MFYKTLAIAFAVIGTQAINLNGMPGANGHGIDLNNVGGSGTVSPTGLAQTE